METDEVNFFCFNGEGMQLLERSVERVAVDIAADAVDMPNVGILPEGPGAFVLEFSDIVMRNPIRIIVEGGGVEVLQLEFVACVEDGFDTIVLLHDVQPLANSFLQLLRVEIASFLDVEDWRQIALFEVDLLDEESGLSARVDIRDEEMIGTTNDIVLACLVEVFVEILVDKALALRCLDEDEAHGLPADVGVTKPFPRDAVLIVADVEAAHFIALGIDGVAVDGFPAEREGSDKEIIEEEEVEGHNKPHARDECPEGDAPPEGLVGTLATTSARALL